MTRRFFVATVLMALFGLRTDGTARTLDIFSTGVSTEPLADALASLLRNKHSAEKLGVAYLQDVPAQEDASPLSAVLVGGTPAVLELVPNNERLRQWLCARIRGDFENGRTVKLKGWILSETEARLCAFVVYRQRQRAAGARGSGK